MSRPSSSRAVGIGYTLVSFLFWFALIFAVVSVVSVGIGVARHGNSLLYGETLRVPLQLSPDDVRPLPPDVEARGWIDVDVKVDDPSTKQMLLRSGQDLGLIALLVAGVWLMRAFLRSVLQGDPFGAANVQRLRALGFILVAGVPFVELLNASLRRSLWENLPPHPSLDLGVAGFAVPGNALIGGLGAFILAEVFAYGLRLREDVEATI
jgi:hypothetical protein